MKIVQVSIYQPGSETGVAKVAERMSTQLSKKHTVLYLCLGKKYTKKQITKNLTYVTIPSIPIKQGFIPKLSKDISQKVQKDLFDFAPDIIHAHNIVFTGLMTLVWAVNNAVPYVVTLHSQPNQGIKYILPNLSNSTIKALDYSPGDTYVRNFLNKADLVISLNTSIDKSLTSLKIETKTAKIPNGIPLNFFYSTPIKKQENKIVFSYFGMYMQRKNQEYLVKTFSHLPDNYQLNLYGNITTGSSYVKKLIDTISKTKAHNVSIHGFKNQEEVRTIFTNSDYFISASKKEVQSLSVVEALASGTPVIGLSNETIEELITKDNGLKVRSDMKPEQFAKRIMDYVEKSRKNYSKIATTARESTQIFNIKTVSQKHVKMYQEIVKNVQKRKPQQNAISQLVPDQFEEYFKPLTSKLPKENFSLKVYMKLTVIVAALMWPIAALFQKRKNNST